MPLVRWVQDALSSRSTAGHSCRPAPSSGIFVRVCVLSLTAVVLATSLPTFAQVVPPSAFHRVLGGVASLDGALQSHWQTDVDVTNHDADATVTLCYVNNLAPGVRDCVQAPVPSGKSVHYTDIVGTLFSKPGTFGVVALTMSGDPAKLEVRARTYNLVKDQSSPLLGGTLGSAIPALSYTDLLSSVFSYRMTGAPNTTDFRQNITFFTTDAAATFTAVLKDQYNNPLGTKTVTLSPWSIAQDTVTNAFGKAAPDNFVDVDVTAMGAGAYLSIVDNTSNAPVVSTPFSRAPVTIDQWVVTSANIGGAYDTRWVTDLTFNSTRNEIIQAGITLLPADQDNAALMPQWLELVNQEQRTVNDVVGAFLKKPESYGALRLQSLRPVQASTRTYNRIIREGAALGTAGMTVPALTKGATNRNATPNDPTPEVVLSINGLREDTRFRSNLMLLNANDRIKNQPLTIAAYNDSGQLAGTTTRSLRTLEMTQVSRVLSNFGLTSGRVTISVPQDPGVSDHPNVLAMATVIDNVTGQASSHVGYPIILVHKVTGDEYVKAWFDTLSQQYMFWSNDETRCLLNEQCGIKGYRDQLARALYPSSNYPGTELAFSAFLAGLADGTISNGELYHAYDPGYFDFRPGKGNVCFELEYLGNRLCIGFPDLATSDVRGVLRSYMENRTQTLPEMYGGSASTGPSLSYNPTWMTHDPN